MIVWHDNDDDVQHEVLRWDPGVGVAAASTPPASWFTSPDIFQLERRAVFGSSWVAVGRADQATRLNHLRYSIYSLLELD